MLAQKISYSLTKLLPAPQPQSPSIPRLDADEGFNFALYDRPVRIVGLRFAAVWS
jgi:hypothetical protein